MAPQIVRRRTAMPPSITQSIQYGGADSMGRLIDSREGMYSAPALAIEENTRIRTAGSASVLTRPVFPTGFYNPMILTSG